MSTFTLEAPGQAIETPTIPTRSVSEGPSSNDDSNTPLGESRGTSGEGLSSAENIIETDKEHELLDSLFESYMRYLKASREQAKATKAFREAEEALRLAKEETVGAREIFDQILESLPQELVRLRAPDLTDMAEAVASSEAQAVSSSPSTGSVASEPSSTDITDSQYQVWLDTPTTKVVEGIPRLGETKAEKLIEQFPTIRQLEEARATAQKTRKHFSAMLPAGCGKSIAEAIADKMQSMLRMPSGASSSESSDSDSATDSDSDSTPMLDDHSDPGQANPDADIDSEPSPANLDDELQYEDYEPDTSENTSASDSTSDPVDELGASSDLLKNALLEQIYEELTGDEDQIFTNWGLSDQSAKKNADWKQGFKAHQDDFDYTDCLETDPAIIREWMRGWIAFDYAI